jgi:peptidyl-prolyl cis-trans isomerase B (cyclophilin B)
MYRPEQQLPKARPQVRRGVALAALVSIAVFAGCAVDHQQWPNPPAMALDTSKTYTATISTAHGDLVLDLFDDDAPITVNNFVFLARNNFYDGVSFHRVIADFMVQGGDPTGTGSGGPGYEFSDEITAHKHVKHSLSMANSGPDTNGSQFFITYEATTHLDGKHTVFGALASGGDVLDKIQRGDLMTTVVVTQE